MSNTNTIPPELGLNNAWPLKDVLQKLVDAAEILLHKKSYDGHGYEEIEMCVKQARATIPQLVAIQSLLSEPQASTGDAVPQHPISILKDMMYDCFISLPVGYAPKHIEEYFNSESAQKYLASLFSPAAQPKPCGLDSFYCKEWVNVGYTCEEQCAACAKTNNLELPNEPVIEPTGDAQAEIKDAIWDLRANKITPEKALEIINTKVTLGIMTRKEIIESLIDKSGTLESYTAKSKEPAPTEDNKSAKGMPAIIQSAFQFKNGKRIIIYTGPYGIKSFECDVNWNPYRNPFAESPYWYGSDSALEYHFKVRKGHPQEDFVPEYSTELHYPEADRKNGTLYTYFLVNYEDWPEDYDYILCEDLEDVCQVLQYAEIHLDDPTLKTKVIVSGVGLTPEEYRKWRSDDCIVPERYQHLTQKTEQPSVSEGIEHPKVAVSGWQDEKPMFDKECAFVTANWLKAFGEYEWQFTAWQVKKIDGEGGWYLGLCNLDGEEWGDINDLKADKYFILPSVTESQSLSQLIEQVKAGCPYDANSFNYETRLLYEGYSAALDKLSEKLKS